jgi:hypothetical protein
MLRQAATPRADLHKTAVERAFFASGRRITNCNPSASEDNNKYYERNGPCET